MYSFFNVVLVFVERWLGFGLGSIDGSAEVHLSLLWCGRTCIDLTLVSHSVWEDSNVSFDASFSTIAVLGRCSIAFSKLTGFVNQVGRFALQIEESRVDIVGIREPVYRPVERMSSSKIGTILYQETSLTLL
jgi:hypothetical protein